MSENVVRVSPQAYLRFQESYVALVGRGYDHCTATRAAASHLGLTDAIGAFRIVVDYTKDESDGYWERLHAAPP